MAVDSFIAGTTPQDELIRDAVNSVLPEAGIFSTLSGVRPFSEEYIYITPASDGDDMSCALVELAFRYMAKILTAAFCNDADCNPIDYSVAGKCIDELKWRLNNSYYEELCERYDYAAMKIQDYIDGERESVNNLVQHCWFLAKLDICRRRGAVPSDLGQFFDPADESRVKEIFDLAVTFRKKFIPKVITPKSRVIFNPEFGYAGSLVGETDCDMIIDRTIVDLRTGPVNKYPYEKVLKSMVYLMLTEVNGVCNNKSGAFPIDNLVFYTARYGETEILHIDDIPCDNYNRCIEKMVIVTQAKYKMPAAHGGASALNYKKDNRSDKGNRKETFEQSSGDDYGDGYNGVAEKKNAVFCPKY